ncbi:11711_t:CDS:2, partial [Gigaspora rosea]
STILVQLLKKMSSQYSISPTCSISPTPSILLTPSISSTPSMEKVPQIPQENSIFSSVSPSNKINNKTNSGANNKTTNNRIKYYKICIRKLTGTCKTLYPYTNSNRSTRHLIYHLRDKYEIITDNYKELLDSSQEPIVKVNQITNYITHLPPLLAK